MTGAEGKKTEKKKKNDVNCGHYLLPETPKGNAHNSLGPEVSSSLCTSPYKFQGQSGGWKKAVGISHVRIEGRFLQISYTYLAIFYCCLIIKRKLLKNRC